MSKTILVIWLLTGRNEVTMQYAAKYETELICQQEAKKHQDTRTGWGRSYPVKYAECLIEIKK